MRHHLRQGELRHQERTLEAGVDLRVPVFFRASERVVRDVDACVVEQDVEPSELLDGLAGRAAAVVGSPNVRLNEGRVSGGRPGRRRRLPRKT
jgi:hypothetical protein